MDVLSHVLWGGIAFGRHARRAFLAAAVLSLAPDAMTEGLFAVLYVLRIGSMPGWDHGHPDITAYPPWAQILYSGTHSLVVFLIVFTVVSVLARMLVRVLGAWALHILIDIPTHSQGLFQTPFLWPVSDFRFDGVTWGTPRVLAVDALLLVAAYSLWLGTSPQRKAGPERTISRGRDEGSPKAL